MRTLALAALLVILPASAFADDDACVIAANKALDATVAETITLATATKYMGTHDDWCDGTVMSLEQQDGAAVDLAWNEAIKAQSVCMQNDKAALQMTKLIVSLHNRRLRISSTIDALSRKCQ